MKTSRYLLAMALGAGLSPSVWALDVDGLYSICPPVDERVSNLMAPRTKPSWPKVGKLAAAERDGRTPWQVDAGDVRQLLSRDDLSVSTSRLWNLDTPVTFVGNVTYEDGSTGVVALAGHRVCLTRGATQAWYFEWARGK